MIMVMISAWYSSLSVWQGFVYRSMMAVLIINSGFSFVGAWCCFCGSASDKWNPQHIYTKIMEERVELATVDSLWHWYSGVAKRHTIVGYAISSMTPRELVRIHFVVSIMEDVFYVGNDVDFSRWIEFCEEVYLYHSRTSSHDIFHHFSFSWLYLF